MKRFIILTITLVLCCCSNEKINSGETPDEGFVATGWNGYYVEAMAEAYDYFLENDEMPNSIKVEGIGYGRGKYLAAGCQLLKKMIAEPETWQDEEVSYINASCSGNDANNTLNIDEISFSDFLEITEVVYEWAEERTSFPNYHTLQSEYTDSDGSVYSIKMTINAISVIMARIFDYYVDNNAFPETVSTWHSDFLRSVNNCPIDDPVVVAAAEKAVEGKVSEYDRAKALFEYVRDECEWINYANTRYGAVTTLKGGEGNCCDLSHALVAMSRAAGVPARYFHAQCQYRSGVIGHVMAELYADGKWYLCDPSNNENTFGNHEAWSQMATFNGRYNELPF